MRLRLQALLAFAFHQFSVHLFLGQLLHVPLTARGDSLPPAHPWPPELDPPLKS